MDNIVSMWNFEESMRTQQAVGGQHVVGNKMSRKFFNHTHTHTAHHVWVNISSR